MYFSWAPNRVSQAEEEEESPERAERRLIEDKEKYSRTC